MYSVSTTSAGWRVERPAMPIWSNANFFYDCTANAKSETCMGMDDPPVSPNYPEKYDRILFGYFYHAIHVIYSIGIQHDHSNDCDSLIASPRHHTDQRLVTLSATAKQPVAP